MTTDKQSSDKAHRRAVRREIILPFVGGLILVILLVVVAALEGKTATAGLANTLGTVLLLCPLALCLIPVYLVLVLAIVGMNQAHGSIGKPLRSVQLFTVTVRDRTYSISDRVARTSININARFAPLDKLVFSRFDRPAQNEDDDE